MDDLRSTLAERIVAAAATLGLGFVGSLVTLLADKGAIAALVVGIVVCAAVVVLALWAQRGGGWRLPSPIYRPLTRHRNGHYQMNVSSPG